MSHELDHLTDVVSHLVAAAAGITEMAREDFEVSLEVLQTADPAEVREYLVNAVKRHLGEIRPYGPGKFDTLMDAAVYSLSLDGANDDEAGSVEETGVWYGLVTLGANSDVVVDQHCDPGDPLNAAEKRFLRRQAGCVISEDSEGFVRIEYFEKEEDLMKFWGDVVEVVAEQ